MMEEKGNESFQGAKEILCGRKIFGLIKNTRTRAPETVSSCKQCFFKNLHNDYLLIQKKI